MIQDPHEEPTRLPGTVDSYLNWRLRCPVSIEELGRHPVFIALIGTMAAERPQARRGMEHEGIPPEQPTDGARLPVPLSSFRLLTQVLAVAGQRFGGERRTAH